MLQSHSDLVRLDHHVAGGLVQKCTMSFEKHFGKIIKIYKNVLTLSFSS